MKRQLLTEVRVGLFVLFGLVIVMTIVFMLGGEGKFFERHYRLKTKFVDISGLRVGAMVQLGGLGIGMVDEIRFSHDPYDKEITVVMRINKAYQKRIRADSVATINTQGLLGDKFIFISVGSENQPILGEGAFVASEETTPIFALAEKAGKILDDIGAASQSIRQMLETVEGEKGGDLRETLRSIRHTVEQIEKGPGLVNALIYDPAGKNVVSNLSRTLESISDITEGMSGKDKKQTKGLIANLKSASDDLKEILAGINRGEGTVGMLIKDPALYNEIRTFFGRANKSKLVRSVVRATLDENDRQVVP